MSGNKVTSKNTKHGLATSFKDEIPHDAVCFMQVRHSDIEQMPLSLNQGGNIYYSEVGILGLYYCNHSVQVAGGPFCNNVQLQYALAMYTPVCTSCSNTGAMFFLMQSCSLINNDHGVNG